MVSTTKLSSKGQVVIPEDVRKRLGLEPGDQFVVISRKGAVILAPLVELNGIEFDADVEDAKAVAMIAQAQSDPDRAERGKAMADALRAIADRGGAPSIADPVQWQRDIRKDRPLPGREE